MAEQVKEAVRERYAAAAKSSASGGCCASEASCSDTRGHEVFGAALYDDGSREELPEAARLASLGCGNPTAVAELHEGETVLDLGSGGGIDVLLSARRVGAAGEGHRAGKNPRKGGVPRPKQRRGRAGEAGVG